MNIMFKDDELFQKIKSVIKGSVVFTDLQHAEGVLNWVLKLNPTASFEVRVAALAHDIERGFNGENKIREKDFSNYEDYKAVHARRGAEIITDILKQFNYPENFIERVYYLVANHEVGGDSDANDIRDADSISLFVDNIDGFMDHHSFEQAIHKVGYMFDRLEERNKVIAKPFYDQALIKIEKYYGSIK